MLILNALPKSFQGYVQSIMNREQLPFVMHIESKLVAEEMWMKLEDGNTSNNIGTNIGTNDEAMMITTQSRQACHPNECCGYGHTSQATFKFTTPTCTTTPHGGTPTIF